MEVCLATRRPRKTEEIFTRRELERVGRLSWLLELEVSRLVEDVRMRRNLLLTVWSRMRKRGPLVRTLGSRYETIPAEDLMLLPGEVLTLVDHFYRLVDEFRLYLETTEDMPRTLLEQYDMYMEQLENVAPPLVDALRRLGGREEREQPPEGGALLEMIPWDPPRGDYWPQVDSGAVTDEETSPPPLDPDSQLE